MNYEKIIQELLNKNWSANENFLDLKTCEDLILEIKNLDLKKAEIGSGNSKSYRPEIRSDSIYWLEHPNISPLQQIYLDQASKLQKYINRELYLGLKEFECHLAAYESGAHYSKHTDQFKGNNARAVTLITYLNDPQLGGELVIYKKDNPTEIDQIIKPKAGLMVCFLSDELYHEVLPTKNYRYSITGWFKNRI